MQHLSVFDPGSPHAAQLLWLWNLSTWVSGFVLVFVAIPILYIVVRCRACDSHVPPRFAGNTKLEIIWTIIPTALVGFLFLVSIKTASAIDHSITRVPNTNSIGHNGSGRLPGAPRGCTHFSVIAHGPAAYALWLNAREPYLASRRPWPTDFHTASAQALRLPTGKWKQIVFEGNPEFGAQLQRIVFAGYAMDCGAAGYTQVTTEQAIKFAKALLKGQKESGKIPKTLLEDKFREVV